MTNYQNREGILIQNQEKRKKELIKYTQFQRWSVHSIRGIVTHWENGTVTPEC